MNLNLILLTLALTTIADILSLPTGAAEGVAASGGKAASTSAMAAKGFSSSQHREVSVVRGSATFAGPSFLIVDAMPLEAQVFLDGRLFGSATQLMAHAFPLAPGRHIVSVVATGFKPYSVPFVADPIFSTHLRIALSPE